MCILRLPCPNQSSPSKYPNTDTIYPLFNSYSRMFKGQTVRNVKVLTLCFTHSAHMSILSLVVHLKFLKKTTCVLQVYHNKLYIESESLLNRSGCCASWSLPLYTSGIIILSSSLAIVVLRCAVIFQYFQINRNS